MSETRELTVVVGLEVHVQLLTQSKIFCACVNRFNPDEPNTQTCPVCLGLPGALPVMNAEAFRLSLITALALNCEIAPFTKWDRKQYYYPDLPKAYQISQYDLPFSHDGWLEVQTEQGDRRKVRINRAHLEEDAGKNLHDESGRGGDSQVDLNRCGTPLLEIVSEPDIRSAAEAKAYLEELHLLLTYLGVSDCNMQEGSLRCDANVNLHLQQDGETIATPIVEIKNLNSFRGVEASIAFEVQRQFEEFQTTGLTLGAPGAPAKTTRGWNADRGVTFAQRTKEEASDYRYFPDPDLVPITVSPEQIQHIRDGLCEFPAARRGRFQEQFGLSEYDASVLINQGRAVADYFESVANDCGDGKQAANWVTQTVLRELKERSMTVEQFPISAEMLASVLKRVVAREITVNSGREVLNLLLIEAEQGIAPTESRIRAIIDEQGLAVPSDTSALDTLIDAAAAKNVKAAEDVRAGKLQAAGPLIGMVMGQLKGADPRQVRERIIARLSGG
jgi:aspartyl-tRNA(Asn)/glutamyl-tRNA(Gln) amidotransferase subunit B